MHNAAIEELERLKCDAEKALALSPEEVLKKYPKLIKSFAIENGKVTKIELHKL